MSRIFIENQQNYGFRTTWGVYKLEYCALHTLGKVDIAEWNIHVLQCCQILIEISCMIK